MMEKAERTRSPLQGRIEWWIWILLAAGTGIGYGLFSWEFALGVLLGGIIGIANFYWLSRDLGVLLGRQAAGETKAKPKTFMLVRHYVRLVLTAGVLFLVITKTPAHVLGLLLGLSVVIAGIFLAVATKTNS